VQDTLYGTQRRDINKFERTRVQDKEEVWVSLILIGCAA